MAGSSKEAAEPVMAQGNIITGNAIPENTPYTERASDVESPYSVSFIGSMTVSMPESRLTHNLLRLRGTARWHKSDSLPRDSKCSALSDFNGFSACLDFIKSIMLEKSADEHSPVKSPVQYAESGSPPPLFKDMPYSTNTVSTRVHCSIIIDTEGITVFLPA